MIAVIPPEYVDLLSAAREYQALVAEAIASLYRHGLHNSAVQIENATLRLPSLYEGYEHGVETSP